MIKVTGVEPRIGYHAYATDQQGRSLPGRMWGWDMPVLADFDTLEAATEWARVTLAEDNRAYSVSIRQSIQQIPGVSGWKMGPHVATVTR